MAVNVHIEHILNTLGNIWSNIDLGQIAIRTDGNEEFIWANSDKSKIYISAPQYYYNGSVNYCDVDFNQITLHSDLLVSEYIKRSAGTDDRIRFQNDQIDIEAGGIGALRIEDNKVTINVLDVASFTTTINADTTINGDLTVTGSFSIGSLGDIVCTSIDTGQGAVECYAMDQPTRTTDGVTFATVNTGQGANELYAMNQNVLTSSNVQFAGLTCATIDTGQGATEVYLMNQNVRTTDTVEFDKIGVNIASPVRDVQIANTSISGLAITTDNTGHTITDGLFVGVDSSSDVNIINYEETSIKISGASVLALEIEPFDVGEPGTPVWVFDFKPRSGSSCGTNAYPWSIVYTSALRADSIYSYSGGNITFANNVDINGGNIDGTVIGASSPTAGTFSTLSLTGDFELNASDLHIRNTGLSDHGIYFEQNSLPLANIITETNSLDINISASKSLRLRYDSNNEMTISSGGVAVTGNLTCATIDTGQGATEVYLMNQNVRTTDTVWFTKLGVATSTPNEAAHIIGELFVDYGDAGTYGASMRMAANSSTSFISANSYYLAPASRYTRNGGSSVIDMIWTSGSDCGDVRIYTAPEGVAGNSISYTERLRLKQNGNFGLGDTNPAYKAVFSDGTYAINFDATNIRIGSNSDSQGLQLVGGIPDGTNMGGEIFLGGNSHSADASDILFRTDGSTRWKILNTTGGIVPNTNNAFSIGTSSLRLFSLYSSDIYLYCSGSTGGSDLRLNTSTNIIFYDTSAKKYKTNIRKTVDTSFIYKINVVKYDRKDKSKKDEIGIIADSLVDVAPDYVNYNSKGEVENYNKSDLVPALINELQKLKKEIDFLKIKIYS